MNAECKKNVTTNNKNKIIPEKRIKSDFKLFIREYRKGKSTLGL